ncbi:hypothetical protein MKL26_07790 [Streptococcus suis]|nr:hypothetical protein [Streptococcus suis]
MKKGMKIFIIVAVIVGGITMFFSLNGKITEEKQKRELETSIAKMIVNDYEGVKKIEFTGWGHSPETGMWGTTVIINGDNRMSLSFDDLSSLEKISVSSYHPNTFKLIESKNIIAYPRIDDRLEKIHQTSLKGVEIIYSENSKEE